MANASIPIDWSVKHFGELSLTELHDLLAARVEVFVVEQNCAFQDIDGRDLDAWHLLGKCQENTVAAYSRILAPGTIYREPSIGRIITTSSFRGRNLGRELLRRSIDFCRAKHPLPIRIAAQLRLEKFYEEFDFVRAGPVYLEDGIEHIEMLRT